MESTRSIGRWAKRQKELKVDFSEQLSDTVSSILVELIEHFEPGKLCQILVSDFLNEGSNLFGGHECEIVSSTEKQRSPDIVKFNQGKYDFIFASFPLSLKAEKHFIPDVLNLLSPDGLSIFLLPSHGSTVRQLQNTGFREQLNDRNLGIRAYIEIPLSTSFKSALVIIGKANGIQESFFCQIDHNYFLMGNQKQTICENIAVRIGDIESELMDIEEAAEYFSEEEIAAAEEHEDTLDGFSLSFDEFNGFQHWELRKEIDKLQTDYGDYKIKNLDEIGEVELINGPREHEPDSLYIPKHGNSKALEKPPTGRSTEFTRHFRVLITDTSIKKEYLLHFLNNEVGQKALELQRLKAMSSVIPTLLLDDVKKLPIPVPNIGVQTEILAEAAMLKKIKEIISDIESTIAFRPISSSEEKSRLERIYKNAQELSKGERHYLEIRNYESMNREFKQTFALCINKKTREQYVIDSAIKAIQGFLNCAEAGTLYIGVADNRAITGIEAEVGGKGKLFKSEDQYLRSFLEIISKRLGRPIVSKFVKHEIIPIQGRRVLVVECSPSDEPVFDNDVFYLREGPRTISLNKAEILSFCISRFPKMTQ